MEITLGQQYNVGEKPTIIILYTYINLIRDARKTAVKTKQRQCLKLGIEPESWLQSHELGF